MTAYPVIRNPDYDFSGQSYADSFPNIHKYPATMLPQIGIKILSELDINQGKLFDPYCGSGSSFSAGLWCGLKDMVGYDLNPLAILISKAKFTKVGIDSILLQQQILRDRIFEFVKVEDNYQKLTFPNFYNIDYWFSENVIKNLSLIKYFLEQIPHPAIRQLFFVPFLETVRECSYTRNHEFKLYRIKPDDILSFNPDVLGIFFHKLRQVIEIYRNHYHAYLDNLKLDLSSQNFEFPQATFDTVLTSPPYGDSRTTVAYGQFSLFANEWMEVSQARKIDKQLMGGLGTERLYKTGIIADCIASIQKQDRKRALEVSAFYADLETSIHKVARTVKHGGYSIYIVGNRRVKNIQLLTDQFIAEKFEQNGFLHQFTYERRIGNKVMPSRNSPTNKKGKTRSTMTQEYIIVCRKVSDET